MEIRNNILATLAYYDFFDYPLSAEEVFKNLVNFAHLGFGPAEVVFEEIQRELKTMTEDGAVGLADGFYFLFGRDYLVPLRHKKEKISKKKWLKTIHAVWWLRLVPFVRAVFASGSLAINNTDELSDLDVLVVVKHGRIWLARLLINGLLSLGRARRRGRDVIAPDKICLNHYVTDQSLLITYRSLYNAQTYANLVPVYARDKTVIENFKKSNAWVLDYVNSWNVANEAMLKSGVVGSIVGIGELVLGGRIWYSIDKICGRYQSRRIARDSRTHEAGGRVVFNDYQLEFHPRSVESRVVEEYNKRLSKLGLENLAKEKDSGLKS